MMVAMVIACIWVFICGQMVVALWKEGGHKNALCMARIMTHILGKDDQNNSEEKSSIIRLNVWFLYVLY